MYKFATISNGIVTNIIESNDYESINMLKQYNEEVAMVNDQRVEIGFIWEGGNFFKDPVIAEKENKSIEKNSNKMLEEKQTLYDQLSVKESLSDEEQQTLDLLKLDLE
jgi:hypothetical protein